jgi:hypothetical protein
MKERRLLSKEDDYYLPGYGYSHNHVSWNGRQAIGWATGLISAPCQSIDGWAKDLRAFDFCVFAEPGWRTLSPPREPGPNIGTGNQHQVVASREPGSTACRNQTRRKVMPRWTARPQVCQGPRSKLEKNRGPRWGDRKWRPQFTFCQGDARAEDKVYHSR